jgi:hypothetical protein
MSLESVLISKLSGLSSLIILPVVWETNDAAVAIAAAYVPGSAPAAAEDNDSVGLSVCVFLSCCSISNDDTRRFNPSGSSILLGFSIAFDTADNES